MSGVKLQFLGSGGAFGSGGRFQTCLHLHDGNEAMLIDCGASSLIAMKRAGVNPSAIGTVVLTHLHGDHFAGIPFLVLDGQFGGRTSSLVVAGPPGVRSRVEATMEVLFPGSSSARRRFALEFVELQEGASTTVGPARVTPYLVQHACGAPPYALKVQYGGKVIAYSGDTEWTDALIEAARGADIFVCEAYFFEKQVRFHLDYGTIAQQLPRLDCRRVVLTHMSQDMLSRLDDVVLECAVDGLTITV
jgi:ribonuclease BN (tRNA processing enzyme)